jgi:hypothetical protein
MPRARLKGTYIITMNFLINTNVRTSYKTKDLEKVARKLGFQKTRQRRSHAGWKHRY